MSCILGGIHHIKFRVAHSVAIRNQLVFGYGFRPDCYLQHFQSSHNLLKNGNVNFLIEEHKASNGNFSQGAYDIALCVSDVNKICEKVVASGCKILQNPSTIGDAHGTVESAIVTSCIDNVVHTLIGLSTYRGPFLPNYVKTFNSNNVNGSAMSAQEIDHVAIACHAGESDLVFDWYKKVFNMQKSFVSPEEGLRGFVVKYGNTGMLLKALDSWKCSSNYMESTNGKCKLVLVEPLPNSEPNQITRFLADNGGPGIQHIALSVKDIFTSIACARAGGAQLIDTPVPYYDELQRISPKGISIDFDQLRSSGALFDTEKLANGSLGYLFQIFSHPLFAKNTFFLELIERCRGAKGFGAGNILALWQSLECLEASTN